MIKNIKPFLILFVFLIGCGFSPVLKSSKIDFSIEKIETFGDKKINAKIISGLENYKNNIDKKKKYYLNIISSQNKIITSKDTKGDPKTYKIEIDVTVRVSDIDNLINEREFIEETTYNTISSKFELGIYENNISNNLVEKITRDIIAFISSIQ